MSLFDFFRKKPTKKVESVKKSSEPQKAQSERFKALLIQGFLYHTTGKIMTTQLQVKIKRLDKNAVIPKYAKDDDAGMDLVARSWDSKDDHITYGTGLAIEIPAGFVGLIFPRSSIKSKPLALSNSVGVIDSGYRGEIKVVFRYTDNSGGIYQLGDKVAQLIIMPYPKVEFEEVDELSTTERGTGGFGSTGA